MNLQSTSRSVGSALTLCLLLCACGGGEAADPAAGSGGSGGIGGSGGVVPVLSHNPGQDCMGCHRSGGSGAARGIFTVAGTIYRSDGSANTSATVNLYTHSASTLQVALTTDGLGNFFTTQAISVLVPAPGQQFAVGADVVVRTSSGSRTMPGVITNGSCNACHGASGGGNPGRVVANFVAGPGASLDPAAVSRSIEAQVPAIGMQPVTTTANAGAGALFSVSATSGSTATYQWRRNSEVLVGATGPVLDLDPVAATEDGASFDVVVSNAFGSVISEAAILKVAASAVF